MTDGFSSSTLPDLPAFFQGRRTTQKLFALSEFHNFSPSLLNELRLGYNRYNDNIPAGNFQFPGLDSFPNIQIQNDLNLQIGPYPDVPQSTVINTYQAVDNVSYLTNRHSWKFGVDGRKYIAPTLTTCSSTIAWTRGITSSRAMPSSTARTWPTPATRAPCSWSRGSSSSRLGCDSPAGAGRSRLGDLPASCLLAGGVVSAAAHRPRLPGL